MVGISTAFRNTLKDIFSDAGVLVLLLIAPIIYGFYYPLPYSTQIPRNLPIAIVDHAQDSVSRQLIRMTAAAPALQIRQLSNELQAQQQLKNNQIMAMMVIPANLKRNVILGKEASVNMLGNGAYFLASKYAQQAMASAVLTVSAGIEIKRLMPLGLGDEQISAMRDPVPLKIQPLYNANEGYSSYVVPAVAWLILQQTLLIACAMLVSTWYEKRKAHASVGTWLGRLTALSSLHYLVCLGYTGALFNFWGYETGANPIGNLLLIAIFSPCVASIGCLMGLLIKDREHSMQILIFSSLPMFFLSGFSWPVESLPDALLYVRWVFPSTSAIQAGISFNQIGGTLIENSQYLFALLAISAVSISLLLWFGQKKNVSKNRT